MRNNAAYLPESPIVYIILPKSIRNRASFPIFVPEKAAYETGGVFLRIDGYSQLFMMLEITIQGVFYGMGRTMPPAVISVTCNYLRIPMALLFVSWGWGLPGIWWSISITSTMKGIICLIWFMLIKKKALNYQAV